MTSRRIGVNNVSDTDNHYYYNSKRAEKEKEQHKENWQICGKGLLCRTKESEVFWEIVKVKQKALPYLWQTVMSKHIETRKKVKEIADISSFHSLIDSATLSDTDKSILVLHYIEQKDFRYIGDMLGYSESTIKKKHRKILAKLGRIL